MGHSGILLNFSITNNAQARGTFEKKLTNLAQNSIFSNEEEFFNVYVEYYKGESLLDNSFEYP